MNQWSSIEGLGNTYVELQPAAVLTNVPEPDDQMTISSAEDAEQMKLSEWTTMKLDTCISPNTKIRSKQRLSCKTRRSEMG